MLIVFVETKLYNLLSLKTEKNHFRSKICKSLNNQTDAQGGSLCRLNSEPSKKGSIQSVHDQPVSKLLCFIFCVFLACNSYKITNFAHKVFPLIGIVRQLNYTSFDITSLFIEQFLH